MPPTMTLEEIEEFILARLPGILERDPRFVTFIEGIVAEKFPRRDEFARLLDAVQQHRTETAEQFQRVDQRFEQVDQQIQAHRSETAEQFQRVDQRFDKLEQRMEEGFRNVQSSIDRLGQRWGIRNELIEISASVGKDILKKLQRKRQLYTDKTGVTPTRFLLVVGTIHSHRANALRDAGFEVIEPEIDE